MSYWLCGIGLFAAGFCAGRTAALARARALLALEVQWWDPLLYARLARVISGHRARNETESTPAAMLHEKQYGPLLNLDGTRLFDGCPPTSY
jgi:hypothetical protein